MLDCQTLNYDGYSYCCFVAFMIKLGINSGKFKGVKESTVGTYSTEIQKNMDVELCEYSVHLQKLIDKRIRQFLEKR